MPENREEFLAGLNSKYCITDYIPVLLDGCKLISTIGNSTDLQEERY